MRIGLDGFALIKPKTGVGHYTLELAQALAALQPEHSFELISPYPFPEEISQEIACLPNLRTVSVKMNGLNRRWWAVGLPRYVRKAQLDLFHGTNYEVPLWNRRRNVITVHDLSVFTHPETHDTRMAGRARRRLPIMLRTASRVITPTEAVKNELATQFKIDPTRIAVTHEAPRKNFFPVESDEAVAVRGRLEIDDDFILFVGTIEPRKNLKMLLRAFARILKETPLRPQLVIAGAEGWLIEEFSEAATANDFGDRLRLTGYLNDEDLRALYSSCKLFVYPSLYEGFGLPPLEAMACGAPVIASRIPAHEETLNDNALLVDPHDDVALSQAIIGLLENESARERLAKNGKQHAKHFSWDKTAELTFRVYEDLLA
jgi:glycosyltransferase involved in cell wall biosynthesis